jgi:molybdate transport system ATP-binding protein
VRSAERAFENVLTGSVSALDGTTALVRLDGGGTARVPGAGLSVGDGTVFAIGSDEILVALDAPTRISARNVLPARIEQLEDGPSGEVRVDALLERGSGARLSASLTRASRDELALRAGEPVFLVFKTNACRVLSAPVEARS